MLLTIELGAEYTFALVHKSIGFRKVKSCSKYQFNSIKCTILQFTVYRWQSVPG